MVANSVKLDKKDILRALLTDTAPDDTPIIFSNDGLYINSHRFELRCVNGTPWIITSIFKKLLRSGDSQSSPYKYSIKKNELSLRTLSLIHPRAQYNYCEFYKDYSDAIIYLCSRSKATIRAPHKISNSYYKSDADKTSKYKEIDIDTLENELARKHSSSFFSYRRHNRLYKLFDSQEYIKLEKQYSSMWMIDVANCFDSIYTHTISWAIKNKEYIKSSIDYRNQFCNELDRVMQRSNNNETNGIPIGSETSRIFAEIILQTIDCNVINDIDSTHGYTFGNEYQFLRYVDDYMIFSETEEVSSIISKHISDSLSEYNLYISESKLKKYQRPFNTDKSSLVSQMKNIIKDLESRIFDSEKDENNRKILRPKKINSKDSLTKHFINQIKCICSLESRSYVDVSSYLISTLSNRIILLVNSKKSEPTEEGKEDEIKLLYRDAIIAMLELVFFFYTVSPQVTSSYKLAKTIIILDKYFNDKAEEFVDHFRTKVMKEVADLKFCTSSEKDRKTYVSLENLNVLIATADFGENHLIPENELLNLIGDQAPPTYFVIVSILYYIRGHDCYPIIRHQLEEAILNKIYNTKKIASDSEAAHLLLDALSCPFLSEILRAKLLRQYFIKSGQSVIEADLAAHLQELQSTYWFIKWTGLNLIKLLERKELKAAY